MTIAPIGMITLNLQDQTIDFDIKGKDITVAIWHEEKIASLVRDSFQTPFNATVIKLCAHIGDEEGSARLMSFKDTKRVVLYVSTYETRKQWKLML